MSDTSATDIITYIGVPLAVLGVLPILYTFILSIITQRRIRASLVHHGHRPLSSTRQHEGFALRSSPMTSLIEVELPRYTIAPLDRHNQEYWRTSEDIHSIEDEHHNLLARAESTLSMVEEGRVRGFLRGGSWRTFHWKRLIVGRKLYRIQYEDELREPPAEIDFSDLVHFLLDWGAVPDQMGWEQLKAGGLWTPSGTILMRRAENDESQKKSVDWVLRTSVPDESDGVLSLNIRWTKSPNDASDSRGVASLQPGWGRISQPKLLASKEKKDSERQDLSTRIEGLKQNSKTMDTTGFRFRAEDSQIQKICWEKDGTEIGYVTDPFYTDEQSRAMPWFASAASAVLNRQEKSGGLWGFDVPNEIALFVRKESIPCGILVLQGLLDEIDAPHWSTEVNTSPPFQNDAWIHHQRYLVQKGAEKLEASMPAHLASVHKQNREAEARRQTHEDIMRRMRERQERDERRLQDAIASPRMNNKAVAEACLAWLIEKGEIGREWTLCELAEAVLYLIVLDNNEKGEGRQIIYILEQWKDWAAAGGMKKPQVGLIEDHKVEFCFAACLVAMIQEFAGINKGNVGTDMLDCLRVWRKIRLG